MSKNKIKVLITLFFLICFIVQGKKIQNDDLVNIGGLIHMRGSNIPFSGVIDEKIKKSMFMSKCDRKLTYKDGNLVKEDNIYYYDNGKIQEKSIYINRLLEGKYERYFENGNKEIIASYKNNERNGNYKEYYKEGNIKYDINYKNGEYEGKYKGYYSNGKLEVEIDFVNGKRNGKYKQYYKNGKLEKEDDYVNGLKHGVH